MMAMLSLLLVSATKQLLTSQDRGTKESLDRFLLLSMAQVLDLLLCMLKGHQE
jgi:hypothetical protein